MGLTITSRLLLDSNAKAEAAAVANAAVNRGCVGNVASMRDRCEAVGMPLIVEPIAFAWKDQAEDGSRGLKMDTRLSVTLPLVRLAMELGADVIKADMTSDPEDFSTLIKVCSPRPVLVRGGAKGEWEAVLAKSRALMSSGARGLVYGRNIIQHEDPRMACQAFMEIVHSTS